MYHPACAPVTLRMAELPVAVVGAGPVGLAAAAHLLMRGLIPLVLEAGPTVGAAVLDWGHVRIFSPWRYDLDRAARALLESRGWSAPDGEAYPTGCELVERYLVPLAALPELAPHVRFGHRVRSIARLGFDKARTDGREAAPFALAVDTPAGATELLARAVIDASGTYGLPNPLGASGVPAQGEGAAAQRIRYGIPDPLGRDRARYAGKRVLVVGSGHSAFDVLIALTKLAQASPDTAITWLVRRPFAEAKYGGGAGDALPARGALGTTMRGLVERGAVKRVVLRIAVLRDGPAGVVVSDGERELGPFDEIVALTGFRPDLAPVRELRVRLDEVLEAPPALAPLIDPNVHSCGTVRPHGYAELAHPERDFYIAGMKSYGRAPTFLMLTGYEQVRSIASALAGDLAGAASVELTLPETGVCSGGADCCEPSAAESACCGAPGSVTSIASSSASAEAALRAALGRSEPLPADEPAPKAHDRPVPPEGPARGRVGREDPRLGAKERPAAAVLDPERERGPGVPGEIEGHELRGGAESRAASAAELPEAGDRADHELAIGDARKEDESRGEELIEERPVGREAAAVRAGERCGECPERHEQAEERRLAWGELAECLEHPRSLGVDRDRVDLAGLPGRKEPVERRGDLRIQAATSGRHIP